MTERNNHMIGKQSIEMSFEGLDEVIGVQNKISELFYERLQPMMETLFDELYGDRYFVSIERLEIDCGVLDQKNWEDEFAIQMMRKLREELLTIPKKRIEKNDEAEAARADFFFYIENGHLPWNSRVKDLAAMELLLKPDRALVIGLRQLIAQHEKLVKRLINSFSESFIAQLIALMTEGKEPEMKAIKLLIEQAALSTIDRRQINAGTLIAFAQAEEDSKEVFISWLMRNEVVKDMEAKKILAQESEAGVTRLKKPLSPMPAATKAKKEAESIYIANAGLILLHPFIPALFERLKFTEGKEWKGDEEQNKAVCVLNYLVSGNEDQQEIEMVLPKLLCGMKIDEVVVRTELTDEIRYECEDLLKSVITHWRVLKNTSIGGLRETFLQLEGKLSKTDNGWLLQVEQKAVDVLLAHLPWGISIVKLPWMEGMLYGEWS